MENIFFTNQCDIWIVSRVIFNLQIIFISLPIHGNGSLYHCIYLAIFGCFGKGGFPHSNNRTLSGGFCPDWCCQFRQSNHMVSPQDRSFFADHMFTTICIYTWCLYPYWFIFFRGVPHIGHLIHW